MHDALKDYPIVVELPVIWGEMDALGHLNNVFYFRYFESARVAYFEAVEMLSQMETEGLGPILGSTSCRFKAPLKYPDKVWVGARTAKLQQDRFVQHYTVVSEHLGRVAAEGEGTIVFYDYGAAQKTAIPDELRRRILSFDPLAVTSPDQ